MANSPGVRGSFSMSFLLNRQCRRPQTDSRHGIWVHPWPSRKRSSPSCGAGGNGLHQPEGGKRPSRKNRFASYSITRNKYRGVTCNQKENRLRESRNDGHPRGGGARRRRSEPHGAGRVQSFHSSDGGVRENPTATQCAPRTSAMRVKSRFFY